MVESFVQTNLPKDNNDKLWEKYKKQLFKTLKIDQKKQVESQLLKDGNDTEWNSGLYSFSPKCSPKSSTQCLQLQQKEQSD